MITLTKKKACLYLAIISVIFVLGILPQKAWAQPMLRLPEEPVTMVIYNGTVSYFSTVLSDVPPGYDVTNGTYLGWCVREFVLIETGVEYNVTLYSSYDPNMPDEFKDDDWDMVNYILNHKQGYVMDIQEAIWYFVDGGSMPSNSAGQAMVNDALMHGEGFVPGPGQVIAVICDTSDEEQLTIIEVKRPPVVGGEILSINTLEVIAPFLLVLILAIVGISGFLFKKSIAIKVS